MLEVCNTDFDQPVSCRLRPTLREPLRPRLFERSLLADLDSEKERSPRPKRHRRGFRGAALGMLQSELRQVPTTRALDHRETAALGPMTGSVLRPLRCRSLGRRCRFPTDTTVRRCLRETSEFQPPERTARRALCSIGGGEV